MKVSIRSRGVAVIRKRGRDGVRGCPGASPGLAARSVGFGLLHVSRPSFSSVLIAKAVGSERGDRYETEE